MRNAETCSISCNVETRDASLKQIFMDSAVALVSISLARSSMFLEDIDIRYPSEDGDIALSSLSYLPHLPQEPLQSGPFLRSMGLRPLIPTAQDVPSAFVAPHSS